jgi:zinc transport system substrate-binding protein
MVVKKKVAVTFMTFGLILGLLAAPAKIQAAEKNTAFRVVTSFYPLYIMAINVTNNVPGITVSNLTPPLTGCLHDYGLSAADMKKLADADLFVTNGAGMESFLSKVTGQYPDLKITKLAEGIPLIEGKGGSNPHVWVSLSGAIQEVKNLAMAMEKLDPSHAEIYRKNTANYVEKLEALRKSMVTQLKDYAGIPIVTFHEAFPYFAREFGFKIADVVEREPGSEPSAKELAQTVDLIKTLKVRAIFTEPQYPPRAAETLARETGVAVYVLDPGVTGPPDADAYLKMMQRNLETLRKALGDPRG